MRLIFSCIWVIRNSVRKHVLQSAEAESKVL